MFIKKEPNLYSNQQACGMTQLDLAGVSLSASSSREKQNLARMSSATINRYAATCLCRDVARIRGIVEHNNY